MAAVAPEYDASGERHMPLGLAESMRENEMTPEEGLAAELLEGEKIVKTFDVFYPVGQIPAWLFYLRCVQTLGLYYLFYHIERWCLQKKFCTPRKIEMVRGRMAVTSTGRLLVFQTEALQLRTASGGIFALCCKACAAPVVYTSRTKTRSYLVGHIRDVELWTSETLSFLMGICCCASTYDSAVRVHFNKFAPDGDTFACIGTGSVDAYSERVKAGFTAGHVASAVARFALQLMGGSAGAGFNGIDYVDVISTKGSETDRDFEHVNAEAAFKDLHPLYTELCSLACAAMIPLWAANPPGIETVKPDMATPFVFGENLNLVAEDTCAAPQNLVALAPGEDIVTSSANMYNLTCLDRFLIVLAFIFLPIGWPFLAKIRNRRNSRVGVVVTTHRVIKITVARRDCICSLCLPAVFNCCFPTSKVLALRSLFPDMIRSGVIERSGHFITGAFLTGAGSIGFEFDVDAGDVANAVGTKARLRMDFLRAICSTRARCDRPALTLPKGAPAASPLTDEERWKLPLLPNENVLARYFGKIYEDLGPPGSICNKTFTMYPGIAIACFCGIRPFFQATSLVLTDKTLFAISTEENAPKCCTDFCAGFFRKRRFKIFFGNLDDLVGTEVDTILLGNENFWSRVCFGNFCGDNCCPKMRSTLELSLGVASTHDCYTLNCGDVNMTRSIRKNSPVSEFRKTANAVLSALAATKRGGKPAAAYEDPVTYAAVVAQPMTAKP